VVVTGRHDRPGRPLNARRAQTLPSTADKPENLAGMRDLISPDDFQREEEKVLA
jgi:hypothetical protein